MTPRFFGALALAACLLSADASAIQAQDAPAKKAVPAVSLPAGFGGAVVKKWPGALEGPQGIAFDGKLVYVAENGAGRVLSFAPDGGSRKVVAEGLKAPAFVLLHEGALFVSERTGNSLARVPVAGGAVTRLPGELIDPLGVASVTGGDLIVLSHRQSVVYRFRPAPPAGASWVRAEQPFAAPAGGVKYGWRDLAVGKDGSVFVTDELSNAVLLRRPGGGDFVPFASGLSSPSGLVFGPDGALYVTEEGTGSVSRLDADGRVTVLATGLGKARDAAFLDDRTLLVTDRAGGAVWQVTLPKP